MFLGNYGSKLQKEGNKKIMHQSSRIIFRILLWENESKIFALRRKGIIILKLFLNQIIDNKKKCLIEIFSWDFNKFNILYITI